MATGMSASGGNISLTIPKDYVVEGGTEYYIYAEDDLGVYSTSGSRDNPPTINFVEADETSIRYDIPVIGGNIFTHFLADAYMHGTYPEFTDLGIDITDLLEKIDTDGDGMISLR